eukprot:g3101.t1
MAAMASEGGAAEAPVVSTPTVLDTVLEAHREQFAAMKLPEALWPRAVEKLAGQVLDAGTALGFALDEEEGTAPHLRYDVVARGDLKAEEDCWLSGHIWSFPDEAFALKALSEESGAALRMAQLMGREDVFGDTPEDAATNADIGNQLIDELQRYAYPLFDAAGTRYYYVMDEIGSRVRMVTPSTSSEGEEQRAIDAINTCFGVVQSLLDGFTYTIIWLCKDVPALSPLRRATQHRLSLLGRGKEAWEARFEYETSYDWYGGWSDGGGHIRKIVLDHVRNDAQVLIVGTGTSTVPVRMVEEGYTSVHATDYVDAVIEKMRKQYGDVQGPKESPAESSPSSPSRKACLTWDVVDARNMTLEDASYDCIFDKGCMDAMLIPPGATGRTSDGATWVHTISEADDVVEYMKEVARVLRPREGKEADVADSDAERKVDEKGSRFVLFSFHPDPKFVLNLAEEVGMECLHCYELSDSNPKTSVKTSATFKHMFRVYIFAAPLTSASKYAVSEKHED